MVIRNSMDIHRWHLKWSFVHAVSFIRNVVIASCSIEIFRFLTISIVELKNTHFRRVLPVFWAFPVRGPITITSRACERSNDGPKDRKCPKNGQNEAEIPIFQLNNRNVRNLKISMLHIVLWYFFHIGPKPIFRYPTHH